MIDICLLPCGDTAVYLCYKSLVEKLEENHPGPRVHHLLHSCPVRFVPHLAGGLLEVVLTHVDLTGELLQDLLVGLIVTQLGLGILLIRILSLSKSVVGSDIKVIVIIFIFLAVVLIKAPVTSTRVFNRFTECNFFKIHRYSLCINIVKLSRNNLHL